MRCSNRLANVEVSAKRVNVVVRSYRNAFLLPLQSCDLWMFVKENPDRKKIIFPTLENEHTWISILTSVPIPLYFLWFCFTFHNYFSKEFCHNWVVQNSSYNSSRGIIKIPSYDVFQEKYVSAIVNIFYKSSSVN